MFKVAKYITINNTKTYAKKCAEGSILLAKILHASCPAYLERQRYGIAMVYLGCLQLITCLLSSSENPDVVITNN